MLRKCPIQRFDPPLILYAPLYCPHSAYVYWRLLSTDPEAAAQVVLAEKPPISDDTFQLDSSVLDTLVRALLCVWGCGCVLCGILVSVNVRVHVCLFGRFANE